MSAHELTCKHDVRRAVALAHTGGYRVSGYVNQGLNTMYERRGEVNSYPLYRAVNGGRPGLYYYPDTSRWMITPTYTDEDAVEGRGGAFIKAVDGRVPLGEHVWGCYGPTGWKDGRGHSARGYTTLIHTDGLP